MEAVATTADTDISFASAEYSGRGLGDRLVVGIDPGSYSLKAVACRAKRNRWHIVGWGVWRLRPRHDEAPDPRVLFHNWLRQLGGKRRSIVAGLYGGALTSRYVRLRNIGAREFRQAAILEAKSQLLIPENDSHIQTRMTDHQEVAGAEECGGLVVVANREALKTRGEFLSEFGAKRLSFHALGLAQCRFLSNTVLEPGKTHLMIDLGAEYIKIWICRDGEVRFVREFLMPGDLSGGAPYGNEAGSGAPGAGEFVDLTFLLPRPDADGEGASASERFMHLHLDAVFDEIKLSIQFFLSRFRENVDCAWVLGGGALSASVVGLMSEALDLSVQPLPAPKNLDFADDSWDERQFAERFPVLSGALSLAYSGVKKEKFGRFSSGVGLSVGGGSLDMLRSPIAISLAITALLSSLIIGQYTIRKVGLSALSSELATLEATRTALDDSLFTLANSGLLGEEGESGAGPVLDEVGGKPYWAALMYTIGHGMPEDIRLTRIKTTRHRKMEEDISAEMDPMTGAAMSTRYSKWSETIEVDGISLSHSSIAALLRKLRGVPELPGITVENLVTKHGKLSHEIAFELDLKVQWN